MQHILSLSYGKDSLACLGAIEKLGLPLDRIVHAEVWATDTIPGELPPMIEFKKKADKFIKKRYGIQVEHFRANNSFENQFYKVRKSRDGTSKIYGFPRIRGNWCNSTLKMAALKQATSSAEECIVYVGIAADEISRFHVLSDSKISPLVEAGWSESYCKQWCEANDLLSPIYSSSTRGGCWFCHNQSLEQLRHLRHFYPEYWDLMLKWDRDSPVIFSPSGHTLSDFDLRFSYEDLNIVPKDRRFRWKMLESDIPDI